MEATSSLVAESSQPQKVLRVLVDARKLFDGGIGTYTRNLISSLLTLGHSVGIITSKECLAQAYSYKLSWIEDIKIYLDSTSPYSLEEYFYLGKRLPQDSYDIVHFPHYIMPLGIKIPAVITVHDVIHITHPERFFYPFIAKSLISSALKRSRAVITVSDASAIALRNFFGKKLTKNISVIPNSIPYQENTIGDKNRAASSYFLAIFSTLKPHKGFIDLLKAYQLYLLAEQGTPLRLKLCGQGLRDEKQIARIIANYNLQENVELLGEVNDEQLSKLYANAKALLIPSLEEGFYLPLLEAHSYGTPVVLRPVAAIIENMLSEDVLCKDSSIDSFSEALLQIANKMLDHELVRQEHAKQVEEKFALQVNAEKHVDVYKKTLSLEVL